GGVGGDPAVVEDRELPRGVAVETVGDAVRVLPVVEADRRVRSIAPRLRLGPAAPAQSGNRRSGRGLTEEVRHRCGARSQVGTVFAHANAALRIAGNVPGDFGKP